MEKKTHLHYYYYLRRGSYEHRQQQGHVSSAEDGEEDGVDHQQDVGGGQRGEQVDEAAQDQVGLVVVVLVEQVPVRHPAGHQLGDGLCDACGERQTHTHRHTRL